MPVEPGVAMMIAITGQKTRTAGGLNGRRLVIIAMMMMIVAVAMLMRMSVLGHVIVEISSDLARKYAESEREHACDGNQTPSSVVWKQPDVCNARTHRAKTPVGARD